MFIEEDHMDSPLQPGKWQVRLLQDIHSDDIGDVAKEGTTGKITQIIEEREQGYKLKARFGQKEVILWPEEYELVEGEPSLGL